MHSLFKFKKLCIYFFKKLFLVRNVVLKPEVSTGVEESRDIWYGLYLSKVLHQSRQQSCWHRRENYTWLQTSTAAWRLLLTNCRLPQTAASTADEFSQRPTQYTEQARWLVVAEVKAQLRDLIQVVCCRLMLQVQVSGKTHSITTTTIFICHRWLETRRT